MEIIPRIILRGLECDVEEEHTFEVRKHSSSYPLELNSAQRKKVTFWTSVYTLVPEFPISYEYLIHSEIYPCPPSHDLQGSTELFPVYPFLSPCLAVHGETDLRTRHLG